MRRAGRSKSYFRNKNGDWGRDGEKCWKEFICFLQPYNFLPFFGFLATRVARRYEYIWLISRFAGLPLFPCLARFPSSSSPSVRPACLRHHPSFSSPNHHPSSQLPSFRGWQAHIQPRIILNATSPLPQIKPTTRRSICSK